MKENLNPSTLARHPAYSQAVVVSGPAATIYVGGQNATNAAGEVIGDSLGTQSAQAIENVKAALTAAGATIHDVVKWTIAVVDGHSPAEGAQAFQAVWGDAPDPPAVSVYVVAGLADPRYLVEIDAIAAI